MLIFRIARCLQAIGYALSWPGRKIQHFGEDIESWLAVERGRAVQRTRIAEASKQRPS